MKSTFEGEKRTSTVGGKDYNAHASTEPLSSDEEEQFVDADKNPELNKNEGWWSK